MEFRVAVVVAETKSLDRFKTLKMFVLDRPSIPKYTRAKLDSASVSSRSSSGVSSHRQQPPSTVSTRVSSTTNLNRPYATNDRRLSTASNTSGRPGSTSLVRSKKTRKPTGDSGISSAASATSSSGGSSSTRQGSADSGIEEQNEEDEKFILPPRITSYLE